MLDMDWAPPGILAAGKGEAVAAPAADRPLLGMAAGAADKGAAEREEAAGEKQEAAAVHIPKRSTLERDRKENPAVGEMPAHWAPASKKGIPAPGAG